MRVFMGSLFLADVIYMILFQTNLDGFARLVKRGELDLYLVKPISSQFMVSCRKINTSVVGNLLMVIGYFMWAVYKNDHVHLGWEVPGFIVLVMCGTLISYCMRFLFGMISVIFVDASNVQFIWYQLYRLGTRPDILYPNYLRYVIMTAIPVAFIASVPARFLIEGFNIKLSVLALTVTGLLMWVTSRCWRRVLRHYASASS
jgi:ABC-2 type transport system permease protein